MGGVLAYLYFQELREPFLQGMQAKMASIKSEARNYLFCVLTLKFKLNKI